MQMLILLSRTIAGLIVLGSIASCSGASDDPIAEVGNNISDTNEVVSSSTDTTDVTESSLASQSLTNSIKLMSVETLIALEATVDSPHATHVPLKNIPELGQKLSVAVTFLEKPAEFQLFWINDSAEPVVEMAIALSSNSLDTENFYFAEFEAPSGDFSYRVAGKKINGEVFSLKMPRAYP